MGGGEIYTQCYIITILLVLGHLSIDPALSGYPTKKILLDGRITPFFRFPVSNQVKQVESIIHSIVILMSVQKTPLHHPKPVKPVPKNPLNHPKPVKPVPKNH